MFRNYLKISVRYLRKQAGYAFINVFGLGLGLAACVLILLYVRDERRYDRYNEHADDIYEACLDATLNGRAIRSAVTSAPMAGTLAREIPEVEASTRLWDWSQALLANGDRQFYEPGIVWTDSTVFDVFTFPLLEGDPKTALAAPNTVVLTETTAKKYFGDEDPVGKVLRLDNSTDLRVTGVMADVPKTSHVTFSLLGSITTHKWTSNQEWTSNSFHTYIRLRPGTKPSVVEARFPVLIRKYVIPQIEKALGQSYEQVLAAGLKWGYFLQPLTNIHLRSDAENEIQPQSDVTYVYVLTAIAVFILLIACINFMNLATARSANRAKEVGLRKVLGSNRRQLVRQFLGESVFLAALSFVVALVLVVALLPVFEGMAGKALSLDAGAVAMLAGITLGAGLLAGVYPAFILSAFQPVVILKGGPARGSKGARMRSVLVVAQFALSIALLVGTGVVFDQLRYMQQKRLGFDQERLVTVHLETRDARERFDAFREELLQNTDVAGVAASSHVPGRFGNDSVFRPEGAANEQIYNLKNVITSPEFFETMGMELVAGRTFSRGRAAEVGTAFILNETGARELGFAAPEEAVGKQLAHVAAGDDDRDIVGEIVGVVKDFHFDSLHDPIRGLVMYHVPDEYNYVSVRLRPGRVREGLAFVKERFTALQPGYPFAYRFLDEDFGRLYAQEARLGKIYGAFTLFALFIACLGLFGLASFVTVQRTKEIGVRKVLGASVASIVILLSKEFTRLVLVAAVVAFPVVYFAMHRWLEDFAYRVSMSWWIFAAAGLAALGVALLTVSYQSIRAAVADPVKSLRYE